MNKLETIKNILAKEPPKQPENRHVCECGCVLEAHIVHKRKYKRNRSIAHCPRCHHGFKFNNVPQAKHGAYVLMMKVIEEGPTSQGKFLDSQTGEDLLSLQS